MASSKNADGFLTNTGTEFRHCRHVCLNHRLNFELLRDRTLSCARVYVYTRASLILRSTARHNHISYGFVSC